MTPAGGGAITRAAVVGTTAWGTTLAILLARNAVPTLLLARDAAEAARIAATRRNERRLPGSELPAAVEVSADAGALASAQLVCFAVPSTALAENARAVAERIASDATLLSGTKGIDRDGRRMSELLAEVLPGHAVAALSGPNLSRELAAGLPGTTVIASRAASLEAVRRAFHSTHFRVYTTADIVGVEMGGALKNVIAIAGGMADALALGDNAKAAILTRGLAEMTRLGVAAGAEALTFQGLAGVGDLMATAYSPLSRNRRLGELIGGGMPLPRALETLAATAEGASTVPAALQLARRLGVKMPITEALDAVLAGALTPRDAVSGLMEREPTSERPAPDTSAARERPR
ncbi:MAG: NAD(P)-dependent glycerol-3-phosphate dehydrogenase [Dehalococcoidia bacterium]|nr:NAD(P)-dependent glycerol-3-phosphate dehydrogenase [Dehalococcoidia bacterium]